MQAAKNGGLKGRLLFVDDDESLLELLKIFLESLGHEVEAYASPEDAIDALSNRKFDVVISDLRMGPVDGISLMGGIREIDSSISVIIITAHGCVPSAVQAMRSGAYHYLTKPFSNNELRLIVNEALRQRALFSEVESLREVIEQGENKGFIYKSPVMEKLVEKITRFSRSDANVFLTGESGSGKEVAARYLHRLSRRADGPFVAVNCGAIPENLLESELFGYAKGAFTGANRDYEGLFSQANNGTILLDEVGDLPLSLQVKLLRVLQEKHIRPVGAGKEIAINVRVISATHRDIQSMVTDKTFREDLYYRLHVIPVHIPSLSERREDVPLLAQCFLDKANIRLGTKIRGFTNAALEKLITRRWPGNIRELLNVVEYSAAMTSGDWVDADSIPEPLRAPDKDGELSPLAEAKAQFEKNYLEHIMRVTSGNVAQAARIAGRYRADMYKLLRKYNIQQDNYK